MANDLMQFSKKLSLAIHSTENSFGFAYRENNRTKSDNFFIKKIDNDLCNNLIVDFNKFISKEDLLKVNKISVSTGPANFNTSRLIVVLARTLSQQLNCPLDSFNSFELISKRIASKNKINLNHQAFLIYKKLKRKGFIAGKYEICVSDQENEQISILEKVSPRIVLELERNLPHFQVNYEDKDDLKELLNLSNRKQQPSNNKSWEKVLPLYPLSPFN